MPYNSYQLVKNYIDHKDEIQFIFKRLAHGIQRKLTSRQTFRDPFTFKFQEPIRRFIFYTILDVVTSFVKKNGKKLDVTKSTTNTTITLCFNNLFAVHHTFINFFGDSAVIDFFQKYTNRCHVNLIVDQYDTLIFKYSTTKEVVTVSGHFSITNERGHICSF